MASVFDKVDLSQEVDDAKFNKEIAPLQARIGVLQREFRDWRVPTIIVVEGWNASGITKVTGELIQFLDPRGFSLYSTGSPTDDECARPLIWRFFVKTPEKGRIAFFARSWYSRALAENVTGVEYKKGVKRSIAAINRFERQMADDGTVILKFFLHISAEEQRRRLNQRETDPLTSWMITKGDWDFHNQYESYLPIIGKFIGETDFPYAPWNVVAATDERYAVLKVYATVVKALDKHLARIRSRDGAEENSGKWKETALPKRAPVSRQSKGGLAYSDSEYQDLLIRYQDEVRNLQYLLYKRRNPLVVVFEGWDAAGKGGNIMRLVRHMNPRGYDVVPFGKPDQTELDHHYLWRFYRCFPRAGHVTIFDRSWYGRVLVERVEGFCTPAEWKRAFNEINEMEESYVENGGGLIKFWLEVDKDEQLRRFTARQNDPLKQWKITDEDWRNREKRDQYEDAVDEMLARTNTAAAPWTVIESDDKHYARLKTLSTVIDYIRQLYR